MTKSVKSAFHVQADIENTPIEQADLDCTKADLCGAIHDSVKALHLTQAEAAKIAGISKGRISCAMQGDIERFTTDDLVHILTAINTQARVRVSVDMDLSLAF